MICTENTKTNKIINGEVVSYALMTSFSVFLFFAVKQFFKLVFGISAPISATVAFVCAEVVSYLLEKRFVFVKSVLSSTKKQIGFFVFRAAVDFGFYKLSQFVFGDLLKAEKSLYWFIAITMCIVFNYFFDRLLVFDCNYDAETVRKSRIYKAFYQNRFIVLAGGITSICLLVIFIIYTVFPFGDNTVMRMDLYHQYGPLFAQLYLRVIKGKSFFYSWISGGGSNFLGNFFNYLSSPLTALMFLFDRKDITFAITLIVFVKCVLSSVTFSYYLKSSLKADSIIASVLGAFYAFCAYFLAYYWNVMWLDGMFLLPLIILGIEKICNEGKSKLYIASLALLLYSSYYMGYMCCIFSVIYFIAYYALTSKVGEKLDPNQKFEKSYSLKAVRNRKFYNRTFNFAVSSAAAGMLCAVTLIPVYIVLKSSSATSDEFPQSLTVYYDIFDFLTSHLAGVVTTIRSSGDDVLPNVYSGILSCIMLPLYFVNRKYRTKEKMIYVLLLLFFLVSFENNYFNFIWHAFHFPNDLPFRFSYMYSFIVLVLSYKALAAIKELDIKDIGFVGMAWIFFIILAQKFPTTKMEDHTIYYSIAFIIIWTGFLFVYRNNKLDKFIQNTLIILICFSEIVVCCGTVMGFSQPNSQYSKRYNTVTSAINKIHSEDDSFYREEQCYVDLRMDPCYYGYNGMSEFSSMAYESYSRLQYKLGMSGNRINSYTYSPQTPVYNMFYNVKYLMRTNEGPVPSENLYEICGNSDDYMTTIYKNRYYLPIAFAVNMNLSEWTPEEGDPFEEQSELFRISTGYSNVFKSVAYTDTYFEGMSGDSAFDNGTFWFFKDDTQSNYGYANLEFTPQIDGNIYIYITSDYATQISVTSDRYNEKTLMADDPYILDLGYYELGDTVKISLDCCEMDSNEGYAEIYAYTCDENVLSKGYETLLPCSLNVAKHSDTGIEGTISVKEDSYLYSSIPYDESWSVYIDGEKVDTFEIGDSMLAVAIKPGEHTVEYKYTPRGIIPGAIISATTAAGICLYTLYKRKQKKNKFSAVN